MQFGALRAQLSAAPAQFSLQQVRLSIRLLLTVERATAPLDCQGRERIIGEFIGGLSHV